MSSILDCPICTRLPQKSSQGSLPPGADRLTEGPGDMKRCPECQTCYYYSYDYDPGEPMVPSSETYTLSRFTPALALAQLQGVSEHQKAAARPYLEALTRDWEAIHASLAAVLDGPLPALPHVVKYLVESLSDYYLEKNDKAAFRKTLFGSRHAAVRANAATDLLYVATEEHAVWTVRMFSRHQQKLAAEWLKDDAFTLQILQTLVGCLDDHDETLALDGVLGYLEREACETAYVGLTNAFFRKLDASPVVPALLAVLVEAERGSRKLAARLLEDAAESQPGVKPMIREALAQYSGEMFPEVAGVLKAAGVRRREA